MNTVRHKNFQAFHKAVEKCGRGCSLVKIRVFAERKGELISRFTCYAHDDTLHVFNRKNRPKGTFDNDPISIGLVGAMAEEHFAIARDIVCAYGMVCAPEQGEWTEKVISEINKLVPLR
jgi:hypothetical protein